MSRIVLFLYNSCIKNLKSLHMEYGRSIILNRIYIMLTNRIQIPTFYIVAKLYLI